MTSSDSKLHCLCTVLLECLLSKMYSSYVIKCHFNGFICNILYNNQGCGLGLEVLVSRRTFERSRLGEIWEDLGLDLVSY